MFTKYLKSGCMLRYGIFVQLLLFYFIFRVCCFFSSSSSLFFLFFFHFSSHTLHTVFISLNRLLNNCPNADTVFSEIILTAGGIMISWIHTKWDHTMLENCRIAPLACLFAFAGAVLRSLRMSVENFRNGFCRQMIHFRLTHSMTWYLCICRTTTTPTFEYKWHYKWKKLAWSVQHWLWCYHYYDYYYFFTLLNDKSIRCSTWKIHLFVVKHTEYCKFYSFIFKSIRTTIQFSIYVIRPKNHSNNDMFSIFLEKCYCNAHSVKSKSYWQFVDWNLNTTFLL